MNILYAIGRGFGYFAAGMASIMDAFTPRRIETTFSAPEYKTIRTVKRSINGGPEQVIRYEDMTPEEQADFDKTFEDMDKAFEDMGKSMDKAWKDFDKAFDTPFFNGKRR